MSEPGKIEFNQEDQDARYIDSWIIERNVLEDLQEVWQEMIGENEQTKSKELEYANDHLEDTLRRLYNDWQFFIIKEKKG